MDLRGWVQEVDAARGGASPPFWRTPRGAFVLSGAISLGLFVVDGVLPRGATVAIGYCAVPVIAAGARSRYFLLSMTVLCTVLTWIASFLEPEGYAGWGAAFDRVMVTGVLWSTFLLVLRRAVLMQREMALRNAKRELERSNEELSKFASVVAHDLRAPLNTIGLLMQLLSSSNCIQTDPQCAADVDSIQTELGQMNDFIQSLLVYGRVGSGELRLRECDCSAILCDVRRRLRADLERSGAEISNDPLPVIRADPTLIAELFQNLIENGVKYRGEAAPRIHVSASPRGDGWAISVRDNGIGIRPEDLARIFEPFQQVATGEGRGHGAGLGLATCRQIVARHGGRIWAESRLGEGTVITFTIRAEAMGAAEGGGQRQIQPAA